MILGQQPVPFCTTALGCPSPLAGFSDDARKAITVAPDCFVRWYTIKSIGLGVATVALAFMIGRATVKR
ncbi:MAG: hypothetical protein A2Y38_01435 [Spirochaetes bacterium GWB1_59_5]|nr:MAG: hypothetical protein A2Y38_01435 [Spirochaetes bacterium GWB1_59_5]